MYVSCRSLCLWCLFMSFCLDTKIDRHCRLKDKETYYVCLFHVSLSWVYVSLSLVSSLFRLCLCMSLCRNTQIGTHSRHQRQRDILCVSLVCLFVFGAYVYLFLCTPRKTLETTKTKRHIMCVFGVCLFVLGVVSVSVVSMYVSVSRHPDRQTLETPRTKRHTMCVSCMSLCLWCLCMSLEVYTKKDNRDSKDKETYYVCLLYVSLSLVWVSLFLVSMYVSLSLVSMYVFLSRHQDRQKLETAKTKRHTQYVSCMSLCLCLWCMSLCLWCMFLCLWFMSLCLWGMSLCLWCMSLCLLCMPLCLWCMSLCIVYCCACA